ncbi:MAG: TonB-dependent receptor [Parvularculaceae bacterium]|nr:TonB-dependent receptor [Parvularculaceae bacterium]
MRTTLKSARTRATKIALIAGASVAAMASAAFAQPASTPPSGASKTDEVVVTGSRIGRSALDAPQPLIQLQGEEVINSGEANVIDYLADVPALQGSVVPEDTTGAGLGDGGLSLLNLRQLGTARTLVLVDGRRHVGGSPGTSAVDVDTIPRLLIKDIEIITGASSAVYGADAVSGVVNFVLNDGFEGLKLDVAGASIAQGFEGYNYRVSGVVGKNFLNDRINVYLSGEYEKSDEIKQSQLDLNFRDSRLVTVDLDIPAQLNDGITDVRAVLGGLTTISRPKGGIFTLGHDLRQIGVQDNVNIAASGVPCQTAAQRNSTTSGNCFLIDPPFSYQFGPGGTVITPNFGTFRSPTGTLRTTVQNGSGDDFAAFQNSQLPKIDGLRFQAGVKFEITPNLKFFAEGKFVRENSLDNFQPAFFDVQFARTTAAETALTTANQATLAFPFGGLASLNQFRLPIFASNENPLIPATIRTAITNNVITNYASNTCSPSPTTGLCTNAAFYTPTGTTPYQVGQVRAFTFDYGDRPQQLRRDTYRAVGGFRGSFDQLAFIKNVNWEVGYTWGQVADSNDEFGTIDVVRFANALDVIANPNPALGTVGAPICRIKVLAAAGLFGFSPSDPVVRDCVPASLFGTGGLTASAPYVLTNLNRTNQNNQHDVLGFISGDLFDPWGAGPIQFSLGGEWRKEATQGTVQYQATDPRTLFANSGLNFPKTSFNVKEGFFEARIPLLKDSFIGSMEGGGAVRVSDYSSIGRTTTWNSNLVWSVTDEVTLRGTYGVAVRAPNLTELFSPFGVTFLQITDPCSSPVILGTTDSRIRNNRINNCAALGVPSSYVDPNPTSSNQGRNGGNPFLAPEKSRSWTASLIYQPEWLRNFSMVVDFYGTRITNAIAAPGIQNIVNNCVDGDTINSLYCSLITRAPGSASNAYEIVDFIQSGVNFSSLEARGLDFAVRYSFDLADDWFSESGMIPGKILFNMRGTYVMHRMDFVNINNPLDGTNLDGNVGFPKLRFLATTAWQYKKFRLSHDLDFFGGQDFEERESYIGNEDSGLQNYRRTPRWTQHDLTATLDLNDNFTFRAGVVNLFDNEPPIRVLYDDLWDLFGRRFFVGATGNF